MSPINLGITAGSNAVLQTADMYAQVKNYSGSGDLLDESGNGHDFQFGSTAGSDTNDPLFLEYTGTTYLWLTGVNGNYVSTTDKAQLDITGDIDLIAHVEAADWTPASLAQAIITKWGSGVDRSFYWVINTNGTLFISWFESGGTQRSATSTVAPGFTDGTAHWVRVTIDVDNGGGDTDVTFYTSDDGSSWTQLGSVVNVGATTDIRSGAGIVRLGSIPLFTFDFRGKYHRAIIKDGIDGTVVGDFNSAGQTNHSSWADGYGNTWTISRSSSGRMSTLVDENKLIFGTDDYLEMADDDTFDFGPTDDFTIVVTFRKGSSAVVLLSKIDESASTTGWGFTTFFGFPLFVVRENPDQAAATAGTTTAASRHIAVGRRRAGTDARAYLDGTGGTAVTTTPSLDTSNSYPIRIGTSASAQTVYVSMELMAVAIFKRALTDSEITKLTAELAKS